MADIQNNTTAGLNLYRLLYLNLYCSQHLPAATSIEPIQIVVFKFGQRVGRKWFLEIEPIQIVVFKSPRGNFKSPLK